MQWHVHKVHPTTVTQHALDMSRQVTPKGNATPVNTNMPQSMPIIANATPTSEQLAPGR